MTRMLLLAAGLILEFTPVSSAAFLRNEDSRALRALSGKAWYFILRFFCAVVLFFLVMPLFAIVLLSLNSGSFLTFPLAGISMPSFMVRLAISEEFRQWSALLSFTLSLSQ